MTPLDLAWHIGHLLLPALIVAIALEVSTLIVNPKRPVVQTRWARAGLNALAGSLVLVLALVLLGRDGKMPAYAALVLVCGSVHWGLSGRWRE